MTEFHLHRDEDLPEGIRRLAGLQLTRALDQLETSGEALERRIHEARKSLKRLRALVCLVRAQLGPAQMRWEHRSIGLTARLLGGMRDAAALIEGLDRLGAWSGKTHPGCGPGSKRARAARQAGWRWSKWWTPCAGPRCAWRDGP